MGEWRKLLFTIIAHLSIKQSTNFSKAKQFLQAIKIHCSTNSSNQYQEKLSRKKIGNSANWILRKPSTYRIDSSTSLSKRIAFKWERFCCTGYSEESPANFLFSIWERVSLSLPPSLPRWLGHFLFQKRHVAWQQDAPVSPIGWVRPSGQCNITALTAGSSGYTTHYCIYIPDVHHISESLKSKSSFLSLLFSFFSFLFFSFAWSPMLPRAPGNRAWIWKKSSTIMKACWT